MSKVGDLKRELNENRNQVVGVSRSTEKKKG
jgi:hypothetical protein